MLKKNKAFWFLRFVCFASCCSDLAAVATWPLKIQGSNLNNFMTQLQTSHQSMWLFHYTRHSLDVFCVHWAYQFQIILQRALHACWTSPKVFVQTS
jgi:hypothetical protein